MCILFLHTSPSPLPGGYRLILAMNRDEVYGRPTLPAHFWTEDPSVVGGRDMEPGREGGTWLAMSKAGRIAALLNVFHTDRASGDVQLQGRGNIVVDYVMGTAPPKQYFADLMRNGNKYSPFSFLALQISSKSIAVSASSNVENADCSIRDLGNGTYGQGNNLIGRPFNKVTAGTNRFEEIIRDYGTTGTKQSLKEQLISLLRWNQKHYPDEEMLRRGPLASEERLQIISSVFVKSPTYGTRTHTVILVDTEDNVDYTEWTMTEPIDPDQPNWTKVEKNFKLLL